MPVFEAKVKCKNRYSLFVIRYSLFVIRYWEVYASKSFQFNMEVEMVERLIARDIAIDLCVYVYELTKAFPSDERYGLTSQLRRSAVSVPSNISEGAHRHSLKDFLRFLYIAKGSLAELTTQLTIAVRLGYINGFANDLISRTLQLINALIKSLKLRITNNE